MAQSPRASDLKPTSRTISDKIKRLRSGGKPRVLDIFAGCGGLSLGFVTAGCQSVGAIERDAAAVRTFAFNFHADDMEAHSVTRSAESHVGETLTSLTGNEPRLAVDIVVGGPPCPTFSRLGRAKLRDLRQKGLFEEEDGRTSLYERFLDRVEELEPLAVLMENVPEFLNHRGKNLGLEAARRLDHLGYAPAYTLLNAAEYGVPQWRQRFFLLAIHRNLRIETPAFPAPTHDRSGLPYGVGVAKKSALSQVDARSGSGQVEMFKNTWWVPSPRSSSKLRRPTSAREALEDLPPYTAHRQPVSTRANSHWESGGEIPYAGDPSSDYAVLMRTWPGLPASFGIPAHHHLTRHTTAITGRDVEIFRRMRPGAEFPEAIRIANQLFQVRCDAESSKLGGDLSDEKVDELRKDCVPPYDDSKFPNKWWKLVPDQPVRTLTAHLCKDSYSHIHYDRDQARMITVQEAARLQSFPDSFIFRASMNDSLRQIGNSVPPLLAWHIASSILGQVGAVLGVDLVVRAPGRERKGEPERIPAPPCQQTGSPPVERSVNSVDQP